MLVGLSLIGLRNNGPVWSVIIVICISKIDRGHPMRILIAVPVLIAGLIASEPTHADPYRWCAIYGGGRSGGGTNCYFMTIQQCRAAVSGTGGFCNQNPFYDGRAVTTPEDGPRRRKAR